MNQRPVWRCGFEVLFSGGSMTGPKVKIEKSKYVYGANFTPKGRPTVRGGKKGSPSQRG
jgi:hypothetical protein